MLIGQLPPRRQANYSKEDFQEVHPCLQSLLCLSPSVTDERRPRSILLLKDQQMKAVDQMTRISKLLEKSVLSSAPEMYFQSDSMEDVNMKEMERNNE